MPPALPAAVFGADPSQTVLPVAFCVQARAEPGVMPRVVEVFAKRGLVPQRWHSTSSGTALTIDVEIGGLDRDVADYIARTMRQIVGVETVLTVETRPPG